MTQNNYKRIFVSLPLLFLIVTIIFLLFFDLDLQCENKFLLGFLNTVFITVISFLVSFQAAKAYLNYGSLKLLMLGSATLTFGWASFIAGWIIGFADSPDHVLAAHNTGLLLSGFFHFLSSSQFAGFEENETAHTRKKILAASYAFIFVFFILLTTASVFNLLPPFFINGKGPTVLRQSVLLISIFLYSISSILFYRTNLRTSDSFFMWYSKALALIVIGISALLITPKVGSTIGWAGRTAQYLAGIYFFTALRVLTEKSLKTGMSADTTLSSLFNDSTENYRTFLETISDAVICFDLKGRILLWNGIAQRMFGYSRDDIMSLDITSLFEKETDRYHLEKIKDDMKDGRIVENQPIEARAQRKDGSFFWVEHSISVRKYRNEMIATVILRDLSERKRYEEEIKNNEEIFRLFLKNSPVYMFIKDENIKPIKLSDNYEEMLGKPLNDLIGRSVLEIFPPDMAKNMIQDDLKVLREGKTSEIIEEYQGRTYKSIKFPIVREGHQALLAGYTIDITDQVKAIDEADKLNAELENRVRERTSELEAFSYSVSHDLRTPLRAISGFSEIIMEDYYDKLDENGKKCLTRIQLATERMSKLIDAMLRLSKLSVVEMIRTTVNFSELARTIIGESFGANPERKFIFSCPNEIKVIADETLMKIALYNLLDNACKYTEKIDDARIEFGSSVIDEETVYFVKDNGAGFDMAYKNKLFVAFQRLHLDNEFKGFGIGLTTVQRIIKRHGGRIWAESEPGKGAAFYFTLPLAETNDKNKNEVKKL